MSPVLLADVLGAPVEMAGTRVGVVGDVYADPAEEHVIGVEVVGRPAVGGTCPGRLPSSTRQC